MISKTSSLKDVFIESAGKPIYVEGKKIIQMDRVNIPSPALVKVKFGGDVIYRDNAAVIGVQKPDRILLSEGSSVTSVAIWDEIDLPREVMHFVESRTSEIEVYNKYRVRHSDGFITEDSFTGNAGMHVAHVAENVRRYECSNGVGPFSLTDLVFELSWESLALE